MKRIGPSFVRWKILKVKLVKKAWGMTELSAIGTFTTEDIVTGSCGKVLANTQMKVVFSHSIKHFARYVYTSSNDRDCHK